MTRLARPSVRLLPRPRNSKTKKLRKTKIGTDVPDGTSKWSANCQLKRSKIKVTGRQKPQKTVVAFTYLQAADKAQAGQAPTAT